MVGLNDVACVRECRADAGYITAICDGLSYIVRSICAVMCTSVTVNVQARQPSVHVITVPVMPGWHEWKVLVARNVNAFLLTESAFANTPCNVRVIDFNDGQFESPVNEKFLSDHVSFSVARITHSC